MPAYDYTQRKPDGLYDPNMQRAIFKLWLLLSTEPFMFQNNVRIFNSTAEATQFAREQDEVPEDTYYIDVEKVSQELKPLGRNVVEAGFQNLTLKKAVLLKAAELFHGMATPKGNGPGYGNGQCVTFNDVLNICDRR